MATYKSFGSAALPADPGDEQLLQQHGGGDAAEDDGGTVVKLKPAPPTRKPPLNADLLLSKLPSLVEQLASIDYPTEKGSEVGSISISV